IRDLYVTGVQTCALPIFERESANLGSEVAGRLVDAGRRRWHARHRRTRDRCERARHLLRRVATRAGGEQDGAAISPAAVGLLDEIGRASCRERGEDSGEG